MLWREQGHPENQNKWPIVLMIVATGPNASAPVLAKNLLSFYKKNTAYLEINPVLAHSQPASQPEMFPLTIAPELQKHSHTHTWFIYNIPLAPKYGQVCFVKDIPSKKSVCNTLKATHDSYQSPAANMHLTLRDTDPDHRSQYSQLSQLSCRCLLGIYKLVWVWLELESICERVYLSQVALAGCLK